MSRLICGLQPVREAIRAHGERLERVLIEESSSPQLEALRRWARDRGVRIESAPRADLDRLARGARHQGAIALAPALQLYSLEALAPGPSPLVVALDELEDPHNFGAIIRTAVAMGVDGIVWPEHHSAPLSAATFRASAGAIEHARLCRVASLVGALQDLKARGLLAIGLDASGDRPLASLDLRGGLALVVGAEGKGLRKSVKRTCDVLARLPMAGPLGSLNASVAAAMALYEVARQRPSEPP